MQIFDYAFCTGVRSVRLHTTHVVVAVCALLFELDLPWMLTNYDLLGTH